MAGRTHFCLLMRTKPRERSLQAPKPKWRSYFAESREALPRGISLGLKREVTTTYNCVSPAASNPLHAEIRGVQNTPTFPNKQCREARDRARISSQHFKQRFKYLFPFSCLLNIWDLIFMLQSATTCWRSWRERGAQLKLMLGLIHIPQQMLHSLEKWAGSSQSHLEIINLLRQNRDISE